MGSKRLLNNANWARYNLAVSLRKDEEPSSSSVWNLNLPIEPAVDFHKFFDGENITQQDIVAWINVGMHHIVCCLKPVIVKRTITTLTAPGRRLTEHTYQHRHRKLLSYAAQLFRRRRLHRLGQRYSAHDFI